MENRLVLLTKVFFDNRNSRTVTEPIKSISSDPSSIISSSTQTPCKVQIILIKVYFDKHDLKLKIPTSLVDSEASFLLRIIPTMRLTATGNITYRFQLPILVFSAWMRTRVLGGYLKNYVIWSVHEMRKHYAIFPHIKSFPSIYFIHIFTSSFSYHNIT